MTELVPDAVAAEPLEARGRSFYLDLDPDPVFATLHPSPLAEGSRTGAILCPAFGWDELASHRGLRAFAGALAHAGFPALRFDLPATGDSAGSPRDRALLEPWTTAVGAAAARLREEAGVERIVAIGIGLGGMLACRAMALGAPIDDLVLWAVPSRGSLFVRELRAFARMFAEESGGDTQGSAGERAVATDGSLNVLGFVLPADTVAQLETLDIAAPRVAQAAGQRVLLLGRDSAEVDPRLRSHFESTGAEVSAAAGTGYSAMMVDPQFSRHPREVFELTLAWLANGAGAAPDRATSSAAVSTRGSIEVAVGAAVVTETPLAFDHHGEQLAGVLAALDPSSGGEDPQLCAVLLNAGAVRRIGHSRQYVETARRWAARGVPTLRFDISGVGDSDGAEGMYMPLDAFQRRELSDQVRAAFDELERRGLPPRFIVGGVCSGAYWGLHAALADERVRGLLLMNLLAFFWSAELGAARDARRTRALLRTHDVKTILRIVAADRWRIRRMLRTGRRRALALHGGEDDRTRFGEPIVGSLDRLRDDGVQIILLLSLDEPLFEDFLAWGLIDRLQEWPNLRLDRVQTTDHVFRSVWAQREVDRALDDALERTLAEVGCRSSAG